MGLFNKYDLYRFKDAQQYNFDKAVNEIRNGKKEGHWIWYVYPQLRGLGESEESWYYGIIDEGEAKAYLKDKLLHSRLIEVTTALKNLDVEEIRNVVAYPDDLKIRSCMTLFYEVSNKSDDKELFKAVIDKYFEGKFDENTIDLLK